MFLFLPAGKRLGLSAEPAVLEEAAAEDAALAAAAAGGELGADDGDRAREGRERAARPALEASDG